MEDFAHSPTLHSEWLRAEVTLEDLVCDLAFAEAQQVGARKSVRLTVTIELTQDVRPSDAHSTIPTDGITTAVSVAAAHQRAGRRRLQAMLGRPLPRHAKR